MELAHKQRLIKYCLILSSFSKENCFPLIKFFVFRDLSLSMGSLSSYVVLLLSFTKFLPFIITIQKASASMALVPYSPHKTLGIFHKSERNFTFVGRTLTIHQDWEEGGVAAVVWDAALVLSQYLESKGNWIKDKKVIELGAGTGLVGMVAAILGGDVVVTDRKAALNYTKTNVKNNLKILSDTSLKVTALDWGQDTSIFSAPYDIILGADIVYIEETFPNLLKTLTDLSGNESVILLSCRIRYKRDNDFIRLLKTKFNVKKISHDRNVDIKVYEATKFHIVTAKQDL
ncbi:protein N-lysine methyltransferase METTL21A-like [Actinia tenebrosa]|uniref:Protein N-lysine methyltransferase METTL21A-like n=1 Tax=Actinia tenebrosa TaxID=6105 RepID=A0A6P8INK4_ACTTE|nr:protein N-lysine methyltransferase METTL21A-like [Actinia tenebrosa]